MAITNSKLRKIVAKQGPTEQEKRVWDTLSTAEKKEHIMPNWNDHVEARDEIQSFITIVNNQMFPMFPDKNQVFLPFAEYHGDHAMNWIIIWDVVEKKEVFRKNIKQVDLIDWKPKEEKPVLIPTSQVKGEVK
jgi:hypothetical protein